MTRLLLLILFMWILYTIPAQMGRMINPSQDSIPSLQDSLALEDSVLLIHPDSVILTGKVITGTASFYSVGFDGQQTANGEIYKNNRISAASNNLKLNTWVRVTNLSNGNSLVIKINDRMHPRMKRKGRVIDLSRLAAKKLDFMEKGLTKVKLEVIEPPVITKN